MQDFLRRLIETPTPSGRELDGQRLVADRVRDAADELRLDPLGNLHAVRNPGAPCRVMVDAHCDENGLLVQYVDEKGFLFFTLVGGVNRQLLPGERVRLLGPKGIVPGVIGRKPIHLMNARERDAGVGELTELWIDIGASSRKEAAEAAPIGTYGVVDSDFRPLLGGRVSARAFDNRAGVVAVSEALRALRRRKPAVACHFVFSTQEELGLLGSRVAAHGIDPQLGVCVDVAHATDCPKVDPRAVGDVRLGKGPVLGVGPNYDPAFADFIADIARRRRIPIQVQPRNRGNGTNGFAMRHVRAGVPVAQISIPLRYMHSAVEVVDLADVRATADLLAAVLSALPPEPAFGFRL